MTKHANQTVNNFKALLDDLTNLNKEESSISKLTESGIQLTNEKNKYLVTQSFLKNQDNKVDAYGLVEILEEAKWVNPIPKYAAHLSQINQMFFERFGE